MTAGTDPIATASKAQIRRAMRRRRRRLGAAQQHDAALGVAAQLLSQRVYWSAKRVGLYLAADGEIDPTLITRHPSAKVRNFYLPILFPVRRPRRLKFGRYWPELRQPYERRTAAGAARQRFTPNRLGIHEPGPDAGPTLWVNELDVLLMPLVAFDLHGNRVGMGGGFYDRTLGVRARQRRFKRPFLVGVAHGLQQIERLDADPWDVPFDAIVTDRHWYRINQE